MRQDCKYFESRTYPNGDTVRKCDLDLAPEAPWRCPEDCHMYTRRRADVNWQYGTLVTPKTPPEPESLGSDPSIGALLDAAEDIINEAAPGVLADLNAERSKRRSRRAKPGSRAERRQARKQSKGSASAKGPKPAKGNKPTKGNKPAKGKSSGGLGERFRRRFRQGG